MEELLRRRLGGTAAAVLIMGLIVVLFIRGYAPAPDSYTFDVVFGRAGSGLIEGSDVKARGVRIGSVESLAFTNDPVSGDPSATGVIRLDGDVQLPDPESLTLVVTAKTLLGEKQVEISFPDERFGNAPFLQPEDVVFADEQPTELNEVLETLEPFLGAIDPEELAIIVEALAEQEGEAEVFAENLELTSEIADFGQRTAEQTLENLADLADIAEALRPTLDGSQDRIRAALPEATRLLRENPDDIDTALTALSQFSVEFSELLEVEEDRITTLFETGEPTGQVLEANADQLGSLVDGLATYFRLLGGAAGLLDDDTIFAYFKIFVEQEDSFSAFGGGGS